MPDVPKRNPTTGPNDLSQLPDEEPKQPYLRRYPGHMIGNTERRFNFNWFKLYPWLEYSLVTDKVYCFPCRHFSISLKQDVFTSVGFQAWNRATGQDCKTNALLQHKNSDELSLSVEKHMLYKSLQSAEKDVAQMIDSEHKKQVLENRHYLKSIAEILRLTALQNLAQRGHREDEDSDNRGNFLEMLDLLAGHDEVIQKRLADGPNNAKYTHHSIQDAVLKIMADLVLSEIREEVLQSQYFAIISDETKDLSKKEQLSLVVRYLFGGIIHEEFIGLTYAESVNAESLCTYISNQLQNVGLDIKSCVGQSYDGASVMSGHLSGVQMRVKELSNWAIYVHCHAHRLNLVVVQCCKSVKYAADFFVQLQRIYNFVSGSYIHPMWINLQKDMFPKEVPIELKRLSDTRWSAQITACEAVSKRFAVVLKLLENIADDGNRDRAFEAQSIENSIDLKFVFCLCLFTDILKEMKKASDKLQTVQLNIVEACDLVLNCSQFIHDKRNEKDCDKYIVMSTKIVTTYNLSTNIMQKRKSTTPVWLTDMVVTDAIGRNEVLSTSVSDFLRTEIYLPVLDKASAELDRRFSRENQKILRAVEAFIPGKESFLVQNVIQPFAEHYDANVEDLALELRQMKRMIDRKTIAGTMPSFADSPTS